jgi:nucleotide-binding universal stress UspA family protein
METKYKILLATDYSDAVMNAERYAVQFAKATNSILCLMHVYNPALPMQNKNYQNVIMEKAESEFEKLLQHKNRIFQALEINADEIQTEIIVREGNNAGKVIRKESGEIDADFIVVGTHGASGFSDIFFGSQSWDVIKKSKLPVMVIPRDAMFTGLKHIVFGTEYREGEIPVLTFLVQFAKHFGSEITVLHSTSYNLTKQFEKEMFERFRKDIQGKISYSKIKMRLIRNEDIVQGLNRFCKNKEIDLLVVSPEKPFLFERIFNPLNSIVRKMSFYTTVPLLTIPDFYNPEFSDFWKHFAEGEYVNEEF